MRILGRDTSECQACPDDALEARLAKLHDLGQMHKNSRALLTKGRGIEGSCRNLDDDAVKSAPLRDALIVHR